MKAAEALRAWQSSGILRPADNGLINQTFLVGEGPDAVLQWVNPIFSTAIQHDIQALTDRLSAQGLTTPRLIPTRDGRLWLEDTDDNKAFWRLMTFVPGRTLHRLSHPRQARAAGDALGRFHRAVSDWQPILQAPDRAAHHTPRRMADLQRALDGCDGHPLAGPARQLGEQVLKSWQRWDGELDLPRRICHGDPKISNLRFHPDEPQGICWVDLDTVGYQNLGDEMGDAWRSWCNPAGEEDPETCRFDADLFAASVSGWLAQVGHLEPIEVNALVPSIERLCLELVARFCADAVENTYFQEDREKFPQPGAHNLLKARCQFVLAQSARDQRQICEKHLEEAQP